MTTYNVEFLPVALTDLIDIIKYIRYDLESVSAAEKLLIQIGKMTSVLEQFPYTYQAYVPIRNLNHEYRRAVIGKYLVFYWVDEQEKKVTVARIIYSRRKYEDLL